MLRTLFCVLSLLSLVSLGCDNSAPKTDKKATTNKPAESHDHKHGEEHAHAHHGPHQGHIAEIGEEKYHIEWTHDDASGKVTLYVLDAAAKKEVPVEAEKLVLVTKEGEKATEFELDAVNRKEGKSSQFEIADKSLLGIIESLSDKITAEVKEIKINEETFKNVALKEHEHH